MIGGGDVQHQRVGDGVGFIQHLVDHHAVIADRSIDIGARRGHIGEPSTEAVAGAADLGDVLRAANPADRCLDVIDAVIGIVLLEIAEGLLKFGFDVRVQLDAGSKAPEQVRRDREIALGGPLVALLADAGVHAEDFRNDDDRRARGAGRARDIGRDRPGVVIGGDLHGFGHGFDSG